MIEDTNDSLQPQYLGNLIPEGTQRGVEVVGGFIKCLGFLIHLTLSRA